MGSLTTPLGTKLLLAMGSNAKETIRIAFTEAGEIGRAQRHGFDDKRYHTCEWKDAIV